MPRDDRVMETPRIHKRWADGIAMLWLFVVMALFIGTYLLMDQMDVGPIKRIPAFILLSTVMLVICICQAAGLAIARIELSRDRS
jgi:hypothetical protein